MKKLPFIWDYDIDEEKFKKILSGDISLGRLNKQWAVLRLVEYAPYQKIVRFLGFKNIVSLWPQIRDRLRSQSRKRGFDFLVKWLTHNHPDLIA